MPSPKGYYKVTGPVTQHLGGTGTKTRCSGISLATRLWNQIGLQETPLHTNNKLLKSILKHYNTVLHKTLPHMSYLPQPSPPTYQILSHPGFSLPFMCPYPLPAPPPAAHQLPCSVNLKSGVEKAKWTEKTCMRCVDQQGHSKLESTDSI